MFHGGIIRVTALAIACCFGVGAASAETAIADGDEIGYRNPHVNADGNTVTVERVRYSMDYLASCGQDEFTDVVVYRPRADCGGSVLEQITHDGASRDACPSEDGSRVAWRTRLPGETLTRFFVADADGANRSEVLSCAGTVSDLELGPDGLYLAFKVWGRIAPTTAEIIVADVQNPGAFVVSDSVAGGSVDDLGLNRRRCMGIGGTVYYSKRVGIAHDLFQGGFGIPPNPALPPSAPDERMVSVATFPRSRMVFRSTDAVTGVQNLFSAYDFGPPTPMTSNTNASWIFTEAETGHDENPVVFVSNGDFTGDNADGTLEVFRVNAGGGFVFQMTNVQPAPLTPPLLHTIAGTDVTDANEVFWASIVTKLGEACSNKDWNELTVSRRNLYLTSTPTLGTASREIMPSFELDLDPADCTRGDLFAICNVHVINAFDAPRDFLVYADWLNVAGVGFGCAPERQVHPPVEVSVPAGLAATVPLRFDTHNCYLPPTGTVTVDVVVNVGGHPDSRRDSTTF